MRPIFKTKMRDAKTLLGNFVHLTDSEIRKMLERCSHGNQDSTLYSAP